MNILDYIFLFISVLLITIIVLQSSKDDISKAFSGEKSEVVQKQRGFEKTVSIATAALSGGFYLLALILLFVNGRF